MLRLLMLLCLLALTIPPSIAQTDEAESWEIIERCVGESITPPADWTFEGAVLMTGQYGIHAYQNDWETPHVVGFTDALRYSDSYGALSPDGSYFAVPNREVWGPAVNGVGTSAFVDVDSINILGTTDSREDDRQVEWSLGYMIGTWLLNEQQMRWLDNEHLIYARTSSNPGQTHEAVVFDVIGEEITNWNSSVYPSLRYPFLFPSNDWSNAVTVDTSYGFWRIVEVETGEVLYEERGRYIQEASWQPDSEQVALLRTNDTSPFSHDGELLFSDKYGNFEVILEYDESTNISNIAWSPDGRSLAFTRAGVLHIADIEHQSIVNMCLDAIHLGGYAWSPNSSMIAFVRTARSNMPLVLYDLNAERVYTVAYHTGRVIGWRAD